MGGFSGITDGCGSQGMKCGYFPWKKYIAVRYEEFFKRILF